MSNTIPNTSFGLLENGQVRYYYLLPDLLWGMKLALTHSTRMLMPSCNNLIRLSV